MSTASLHPVPARVQAKLIRRRRYQTRRNLAVFDFASLRTPVAAQDVLKDGPVEGCAVGTVSAEGFRFAGLLSLASIRRPLTSALAGRIR